MWRSRVFPWAWSFFFSCPKKNYYAHQVSEGQQVMERVSECLAYGCVSFSRCWKIPGRYSLLLTCSLMTPFHWMTRSRKVSLLVLCITGPSSLSFFSSLNLFLSPRPPIPLSLSSEFISKCLSLPVTHLHCLLYILAAQLMFIPEVTYRFCLFILDMLLQQLILIIPRVQQQCPSPGPLVLSLLAI